MPSCQCEAYIRLQVLSVYHLLIPPCTAPCLSHLSPGLPHQACHPGSLGQGKPQKLSPLLIFTKEQHVFLSQYLMNIQCIDLTLDLWPPAARVQTATQRTEAVCCSVPCYALFPSSTPRLWGDKHSSPSPSLPDKHVLLLRHGSHTVAGDLSTE